MITTSRYPSKKTYEFAKKLAKKLGTLYVSRNKKTIEKLVQYARKKGDDRIIIIEEKEGVPTYLSTIKITPYGGWAWKETKKIV